VNGDHRVGCRPLDRPRPQRAGERRADGYRPHCTPIHSGRALGFKTSVTKPSTSTATTAGQIPRKPRVLPVILSPARRDDRRKAPITVDLQTTSSIPKSDFARTRTWLKYGMTVRQVADLYGISADHLERTLYDPQLLGRGIRRECRRWIRGRHKSGRERLRPKSQRLMVKMRLPAADASISKM
jgi:hypothetical protein